MPNPRNDKGTSINKVISTARLKLTGTRRNHVRRASRADVPDAPLPWSVVNLIFKDWYIRDTGRRIEKKEVNTTKLVNEGPRMNKSISVQWKPIARVRTDNLSNEQSRIPARANCLCAATGCTKRGREPKKANLRLSQIPKRLLHLLHPSPHLFSRQTGCDLDSPGPDGRSPE